MLRIFRSPSACLNESASLQSDSSTNFNLNRLAVNPTLSVTLVYALVIAVDCLLAFVSIEKKSEWTESAFLVIPLAWLVASVILVTAMLNYQRTPHDDPNSGPLSATLLIFMICWHWWCWSNRSDFAFLNSATLIGVFLPLLLAWAGRTKRPLPPMIAPYGMLCLYLVGVLATLLNIHA